LSATSIDKRDVADYVAEMLAEYSRTERTKCQLPGQTEQLDYFFEMLTALEKADDRTTFLIRAHIGNHSLFLSGVFFNRIRYRADRRGFPDISYYEALGRTNFRLASDHRLAARYDLAPIYATLSEKFHDTRMALNDISDRLFSLESNLTIESLLNSKLGGL
jgi:hypothetical protein